MVYEWKQSSDERASDGADVSEIQAFSDCVRRFLIHPSPDPISVEVGWTLNDYQINVATSDGQAEYKRVMDTTSALGLRRRFFTLRRTAIFQTSPTTPTTGTGSM